MKELREMHNVCKNQYIQCNDINHFANGENHFCERKINHSNPHGCFRHNEPKVWNVKY